MHADVLERCGLEFTISDPGERWLAIPHPLNDALRKEAGGKLRSIPVRLVFNDPDLSLRATLTRFDRATGRPLCVGDGETCRRATAEGMQSLPCPGPEACDFGQQGGCKPFGRLNVRIGDEDELGTFIFRTTGFNSIRTLATRLRYFAAASGGLLAGSPARTAPARKVDSPVLLDSDLLRGPDASQRR